MGSMNFVRHSLPVSEKIQAEEAGIVIPAGQSLKIETTPDGAEIANEVVPDGKKWTVTVSVSIDETDA